MATPKLESAAGPPPMLMKALWQDNLDMALEALVHDPHAACMPFVEHRFDPPLCCAARNACDGRLVRLLIKAAADVNAIDVTGRTPLALLCCRRQVEEMEVARKKARCVVRSPYQSLRPMERSHALELAGILLAAGADAEAPDGSHCRPAELAHAAGNTALAKLLRCYRSVQACAALRRGWRAGHGSLGQLPRDVVDSVCDCLLPGHDRLLARLHL